jgi:hypothetical protein
MVAMFDSDEIIIMLVAQCQCLSFYDLGDLYRKLLAMIH